MIDKKRYSEWLNSNAIDDKTKEELRSMTEEEIRENFLLELSFGTAGLRGLMGIGTNRLNVYTIKKAALAVAKWLHQKYENPSIVIGYDVRHKSREFAEVSARTFSDNNIKTYLFEKIVSTPELSYSIRKLNVDAGIMVTASHNPREYNGYKVYKKSGSQILYDDADIIKGFMDDIHTDSLKINREKNWLTAPDEVLDSYVDDVINFKKYDFKNELKFIYTPFHGTALRAITDVFDKRGFKYLMPKEQVVKDPDFKTIPYPNPEVDDTFDIAIKLANENDIDLIIANDPDGDRLSVMIRDDNNKFYHLTGNQIGALLTDYISKFEKSKNAYLVKTIVSDDFGKIIAKSYGHDTIECLTGFKNIANFHDKILKNNDEFLLGYEESIGYELTDFVRDKDGISAGMIFVEMAHYYNDMGINLYTHLNNLYKKHGYFSENNFSIYFKGVDGKTKMEEIMDNFRKISESLCGIKIIGIRDYLLEKDPIMKTNAIIFLLENDLKVAIRPSGTEPKLKFYIYANDINKEKSISKVMELGDRLKEGLDDTGNS